MAQLQNLHALPIVLAAVAAWIFGAIYYGLLCRTWLAAQGKTMEQVKARRRRQAPPPPKPRPSFCRLSPNW